jgi:hypothetical protein
MVAIVTILVLGIFVFLSVWDSSRIPDSGRMRAIGSSGMENAPRLAPAFAVNPYQSGNPDRDTAVMIGASVSYILREVKYFTLFIVILAVLALNTYALIVYFVLDKIVKPKTTTLANPETGPKTVSSAVLGHINDGKDPDDYIKRTSGMISLEIDEMLAEIDSVMEKCKSNQRVLLK